MPRDTLLSFPVALIALSQALTLLTVTYGLIPVSGIQQMCGFPPPPLAMMAQFALWVPVPLLPPQSLMAMR